jgi:hypothetical protein
MHDGGAVGLLPCRHGPGRLRTSRGLHVVDSGRHRLATVPGPVAVSRSQRFGDAPGAKSISPSELARRANRARRERSAGRLAGGTLARWLVREGLAVVGEDGTLSPTKRGRDLGARLRV